MSARVVPATLRDLSYISHNIRDEDRRECEAQFGPITPIDLAIAHLRDHAYAVEVHGNPEAAFGVARAVGEHVWVAWSWGTRRISRAVPLITRHVRDVIIPELLAGPAQRVEARALADHFTAHRWLEGMGAERCCDLPGFGRDGETFVLWQWTRSSCNRQGILVE